MSTTTTTKPADLWAWPTLPADLAALSGVWLISAASAVVRDDQEAVASIRQTISQRQREAALEADYQDAVAGLEDALEVLQSARDDVAQPSDLKPIQAAAKAVLAAETRLALAQRARGFGRKAVAYLPPTMTGAMSRPEPLHLGNPRAMRQDYPPQPGLTGALLCERLLREAEVAVLQGRPAVLPVGLEVSDLDRYAQRARALQADRDVIAQRLAAQGLTAAQRSHDKAHATRMDEITRALLTGVEPEAWTEVPPIRGSIGGSYVMGAVNSPRVSG